MVWNGKSRSAGKELIRLGDETLICDVDDFGNMIPETCEVVVQEVEGQKERFIKKQPLPMKR